MMNQRQLRKTLSGFYSKKFDTGTDLLTHVVQQIVEHAGIEITGGRVWRLRTAAVAYELVAQVGSIHKIRAHYRIRADRYAMFKRLPKQRTMVLRETDRYLRRRGILRYSATGVGDVVKVRNIPFYQYILSFNTTLNKDQIAPTLDIISIVVSNMLTSLRNERQGTQYKKALDKAREIQQSILPTVRCGSIITRYTVFPFPTRSWAAISSITSSAMTKTGFRLPSATRRAKGWFRRCRHSIYRAPSAWESAFRPN